MVLHFLNLLLVLQSVIFSQLLEGFPSFLQALYTTIYITYNIYILYYTRLLFSNQNIVKSETELFKKVNQ